MRQACFQQLEQLKFGLFSLHAVFCKPVLLLINDQECCHLSLLCSHLTESEDSEYVLLSDILGLNPFVGLAKLMAPSSKL